MATTEPQNTPSHGDALLTSLEKPHPLQIPEISKSLGEVYRAGGIPLALLFVASVALFILVAQGVLALAASLINLLGFLIGASAVLYLVLIILAYLRWRDELRAKIEDHRRELDIYLELYRAEKELQDKFILPLIDYASKLASREGLDAAKRSQEMETLTTTLGNLITKMMEIRARLRPSEQPLASSTALPISPLGGQD